MIIKQYSLIALQKAMNHALALDPETKPRIGALKGKAIKIIVSPLDIHFFMHFQGDSIALLANYVDEPNTTIRSSPLGLIRLSLLPSSKVRSLFNDQIQISGDTELGQAVKQLFDELDIDWEGHLAHFTGDVAAHQIGRLVKRGMRFKDSLKTSLTHNLSDYIQEETNLTPPTAAIRDFMDDIDDLRLEVERLEASVNQFEHTAPL